MYLPYGRRWLEVSAVTAEHFSKEMGVSHADFFRLLPRAMGDTQYEVNGTFINARLAEGSLAITLGEPQVRRIALLAIPYAEVTFSFADVSETVRTQFMHHFDLHFQRGGG